MKFIRSLFIFLALQVSVSFAQQAQEITIIPKPARVEKGPGQFIFTEHMSIVAKGKQAKKIADMFNYFFRKKYGFRLNVRDGYIRDAIFLDVNPSTQLNDEVYRLKVATDGITISGGPSGVFYGVQSLLQIISADGTRFSVTAMTVKDKPDFAYRGLMLDVGRHFFGTDEIKKVLDVMAVLKLNRFHWHLTDDQGWRLEIKKYPKLTAVSAWRDSTMIGGYGDFKSFIYDGKRSGGFYTRRRHVR